MKIQYNCPKPGNPYYNRIEDGGYNPSISGFPQDPNLTVLSNCVGFALGRFNAVGLWGCNKYLRPCMACSMVKYAKKDGLKIGKQPKVGACICWSGGLDGNGHVAIVEQIISKNEIVCSESVYGGVEFRLRAYYRKNGKWDFGAYTFEGFIYNPAITMKKVYLLRKLVAASSNDLLYDYDGDGKLTMKDVMVLRKSVY